MALYPLRIITLTALLLALTACADALAAPNAQPTERPMQPITQPAAEPTVYNACQPAEDTASTRHTVVADINYTAKTALVSQRTHHINRSGQALEQIVFNVEANRWANTFTLAQVTEDGILLAHTLEDKRLTIDLQEPLQPGCEIDLNMVFRLDVPQVGVGVNTRKGFFGYTSRQMNLGHWLPTVAPLQGDVWVSRQAFLIGEQEVLDKANWAVTLNLTGDIENLMIAAPGERTVLSVDRVRYVLNHARDFSLSLSDQFEMLPTVAEDGTRVEMYTFSQQPNSAATVEALDAAVTSIAMFADLFGAYPYERILVIEGDFPDGMEFSGMVFVGHNWFQNYTGTPAGYLVLITVHEVAHQWWYASVGNDPAVHPWLDEALATYSEYIFIEEYYPELTEWWWSFRVDYFSPEGFVDAQVYEFGSAREYINAVYLRGVRMLADLRVDLGTDAFFQLLADYAAAGQGRIATPDLFWSLLTPEQLTLTANTRARYLREPNPSLGG